ncbi:hypothetical protein AB0J43_51295, partial [Nonomuraea fuscirosea]
MHVFQVRHHLAGLVRGRLHDQPPFGRQRVDHRPHQLLVLLDQLGRLPDQRGDRDEAVAVAAAGRLQPVEQRRLDPLRAALGHPGLQGDPVG